MRTVTLEPFWHNTLFFGFDEESSEDSTDEESSEEESSDEELDEESNSEDDLGRIKSALRKERKARRDAEKEARALKKFKDDNEATEQTETAKALRQAEVASKTAERLAAKLAKSEVDNLITRKATKLNFVDLDDALRLIDRDTIEIDQDEDDPSAVSVDEESVMDALKALAKNKPHLIKNTGEGSGEPPPPSGSKFGGGKKPTQDELDEDRLRSIYPALRT